VNSRPVIQIQACEEFKVWLVLLAQKSNALSYSDLFDQLVEAHAKKLKMDPPPLRVPPRGRWKQS
jgi:hypothetical protein